MLFIIPGKRRLSRVAAFVCGVAVLVSEVLAKSGSSSSSVRPDGKPWTGEMGRQLSTATREQRDVAAMPAVKILVRESGWYRVGARELFGAGVDPDADPRTLQLIHNGRDIPMFVTAPDSDRLSLEDAIEFFAFVPESAQRDTNAYWLIAGTVPGLRITPWTVRERRKRVKSRSYFHTTAHRKRSVYSILPNGSWENFFGELIANDPVSIPIVVHHLDRVSGNATVEIEMQGFSFVRHQLDLELNDEPLGTLAFPFQEPGTSSFTIPVTRLREGVNTIRITRTGGETDLSFLQELRVRYPHLPVADDGVASLVTTAASPLLIDGFTSSEVRALDISDPRSVRALPIDVRRGAETFSAVIKPSRARRQLLVIQSTAARKPVAVVKNEPSSLHDSREADLVIIAHRDFLDAVEPLRELREREGLSVTVAAIDDVYDEFGFGHHDPVALRSFLRWTQTGWKRPPRYALLVGDASYDVHDYLGKGRFDFVPTKLIDTASMETASDDWFGDFDDDGVPEVVVGRLPVRTPAEAIAMISKIVRFRTPASSSALVVVDSKTDFDFRSFAESFRAKFPVRFTTSTLTLADAEAALPVHKELIARLDEGPLVVSYIGHGTVDLWRGASGLTLSDAGRLTNASPSLYLLMTCLNGYFHDPQLDGLAERLMRNPGGGAFAVWTSSGKTFPAGQLEMNKKLVEALFDRGVPLGDAIRESKRATDDSDVRRTWILFGDPSMRF